MTEKRRALSRAYYFISREGDIDFVTPCFRCKHKYRERRGCKAFPKKIPEQILSGEHDHRTVFPGQLNDIVFEESE